MLTVTVVGAGTQGTRMAEKYASFRNLRLKAVVSRHAPRAHIFRDVPHIRSAKEWKTRFGAPTRQDVFDLCVHPPVLLGLIEDFTAIGAKQFVLPKPVALTTSDLARLRRLVSHRRLKVLVASQWHYSPLVQEARAFVRKNRAKITAVDISFLRDFSPERLTAYTPTTAFLPHMLQILQDAGFPLGRTPARITEWTDRRIALSYRMKRTDIRFVSALDSRERTETLRIYLADERKPAFTANFSASFAPGKTKYPSFTLRGRTTVLREDVLERMIKESFPYFSGKGGEALTLSRYLPVAKQLLSITERAGNLVAVIGGGIFGILSAIEIAKRGYGVLLLEKASKLVTGATFVNQCRVHMGYHYPRDEKTARESNIARKHFEKLFGRAVGKKVRNHYLIAREGSLTSSEEYLAFCKKLRLPHHLAWPSAKLSRDKLALSVRVPEPLFDADVLRDLLEKKLAASPVAVRLTAEVIDVAETDDGYAITYAAPDGTHTVRCAAAVNATYGNLNAINKLAGFPLSHYQYELCEVPIARTPWKNEGWAIMDGPFFGAMPFGFSKRHLLYDVQLSVLERIIGELPTFRHDAAHYDDESRRRRRFRAWKAKWAPYVTDIEKCEPVASLYTTRIVLPSKEKTDGRPTVVSQMHRGFWQLFSGKITTSVPKAKRMAILVDRYLKKRKVTSAH